MSKREYRITRNDGVQVLVEETSMIEALREWSRLNYGVEPVSIEKTSADFIRTPGARPSD